jgi:hypothetical protein
MLSLKIDLRGGMKIGLEENTQCEEPGGAGCRAPRRVADRDRTGNAAKRRLRLEFAGAESPAEVVREIRKRLTTIARSRSFIDWQITTTTPRLFNFFLTRRLGKVHE